MTQSNPLARSLAAALRHRSQALTNPKLTRGAIALRAFPLWEIASKLGVSLRTATAWRAGEKLPTEKHRNAIELAFAIPAGAFFLAASEAVPSTDADAPPSLVAQLKRCDDAIALPGLTPSARSALEQLSSALREEIARAQRGAARSRAIAARKSKTLKAEQSRTASENKTDERISL
jgi:transcriptional regulator with XRE-family HTH domain